MENLDQVMSNQEQSVLQTPCCSNIQFPDHRRGFKPLHPISYEIYRSPKGTCS